VTLDDLENSLPNGFHDAEIFSFDLSYVTGVAKLHMNLWVGSMEDPPPERDAYQEATLSITGLCFWSMDPPDAAYPFLPNGKPISVSGAEAKVDSPPFSSELVARFPANTWCYTFFVNDWNSFIHIAGRDARVDWIGEKPKGAA
jgi:hypothetical protein